MITGFYIIFFLFACFLKNLQFFSVNILVLSILYFYVFIYFLLYWYSSFNLQLCIIFCPIKSSLICFPPLHVCCWKPHAFKIRNSDPFALVEILGPSFTSSLSSAFSCAKAGLLWLNMWSLWIVCGLYLLTCICCYYSNWGLWSLLIFVSLLSSSSIFHYKMSPWRNRICSSFLPAMNPSASPVHCWSCCLASCSGYTLVFNNFEA